MTTARKYLLSLAIGFALTAAGGCTNGLTTTPDMRPACLSRLTTCTGMEQCCGGLICVGVGTRAICCETGATIECDAGMCCPPIGDM